MEPRHPSAAEFAPPEPSPETLRTVYQQICASHNGIADFRARLLGLLPLASGVGIYFLADKTAVEGHLNVGLLLPIGLFGFVVVFGLFMYELRGIADCTLLRGRAESIEEVLNLMIFKTQKGLKRELSQFVDRPRGPLLGLADEIGAGWIIYNAVMVAWLFVAGYGVLGNGGLVDVPGKGGLLGDCRNVWLAALGGALTIAFVVVIAKSLPRKSPREIPPDRTG